MMNGREKSDGLIVPRKPRNKAGQPAADAVEGRGPTEGNSSQQNASRTQCRTSASNALERVRQAAKREKRAKFTALLHHVTVDRLGESYLRVKRQAAPGVDGVTWEQYGARLEENLQDLYARLHRGAYRAKPSRRTYIPKGDGGKRPLGIAALEDKIVQGAVVEVLEAIYEEDFLGFSYGFRPKRSPHDALDALAAGILRRKVNWVLDADIRGFFDAIDHGWVVKFIEHRIGDRRVLRLIQKWLAAGVMEDGQWTESQAGRRRERRCRPCWPTCTCITFWTCGCTNGGSGRRAGTWSSCATPTTSWWGFSIVGKPSGSKTIFARGCASSGWSCTRRKRA